MPRKPGKKQSRLGEKYRTEVLEIKQSKQLTAHVARPHSERDLRDFAKLREGETAKQAEHSSGQDELKSENGIDPTQKKGEARRSK